MSKLLEKLLMVVAIEHRARYARSILTDEIGQIHFLSITEDARLICQN